MVCVNTTYSHAAEATANSENLSGRPVDSGAWALIALSAWLRYDVLRCAT